MKTRTRPPRAHIRASFMTAPRALVARLSVPVPPALSRARRCRRCTPAQRAQNELWKERFCTEAGRHRVLWEPDNPRCPSSTTGATLVGEELRNAFYLQPLILWDQYWTWRELLGDMPCCPRCLRAGIANPSANVKRDGFRSVGARRVMDVDGAVWLWPRAFRCVNCPAKKQDGYTGATCFLSTNVVVMQSLIGGEQLPLLDAMAPQLGPRLDGVRPAPVPAPPARPQGGVPEFAGKSVESVREIVLRRCIAEVGGIAETAGKPTEIRLSFNAKVVAAERGDCQARFSCNPLRMYCNHPPTVNNLHCTLSRSSPTRSCAGSWTGGVSRRRKMKGCTAGSSRGKGRARGADALSKPGPFVLPFPSFYSPPFAKPAPTVPP